MYSHAAEQLDRLRSRHPDARLTGGLTGLEVESLRVGPDGAIAQTTHPARLGSALKHPWITTDYSEALMEFITPPLDGPLAALDFLRDLQQFVHLRLGDELLWSASMPCVVEDEEHIPLALYGSSNSGQMKTVYRRGLGYRYGRVMQVIAGAHYNYSFPEALWPMLQSTANDSRPLQDFISDRYFGVIRNLQHVGWIVPYLFGSSPAVCKSFLCGKPTILDEYNTNSYYGPHATSLRMCDIGYQNTHEDEIGFKARYDNLDSYVESLTMAIETNCPRYEKIGVKVDGQYRQLNSNMLQIENEYYSTIRPKRVIRSGDHPSEALRRRGVEYIELRALDVSPFDPIGISHSDTRFLEVFAIYCLLENSPAISPAEQQSNNDNHANVARRGRLPGLQLSRDGELVSLIDWGRDITARVMQVAEVMDKQGGKGFVEAVQTAANAIEEPELTPSARLISELRETGQPMAHYGLKLSADYRDYFKSLAPEMNTHWSMLAEESELSVQRQAEVEAADNVDFDEYLAAYFR